MAWAVRAQGPAPTDYRAYPLKHKTAAEIEQMLRDVLPGLGTTTHLMADTKTNQVLLRGPEQVHQIARQLIDSADLPERSAPAEQPVVQTYPCDASRLQATAERIRSAFASFGVRVAIDPRSPQLLVLAPPSIHNLVARLVSGGSFQSVPSETPRPLPRPDVVAAGPPASPAETAIRQTLASREPRKEECSRWPMPDVGLWKRLRDLLGPLGAVRRARGCPTIA